MLRENFYLDGEIRTLKEKERDWECLVYIYIYREREREGFLFLFGFEFYFDTIFFFNPNPNVCLSNIAICPYFNSHLLSSMAPGIHYYFNFNFFSLFLFISSMVPPISSFFVLSYFILLYLLIKILYYPLSMATHLSKSRFECFTSFTEESSFNFHMKKWEKQ